VRLFFILLLGATLQLLLLAAFVAIRWSRLPFPGFLVEQTLVVTDANGRNWSGRQAGISHPQKVIRVGETPVRTLAEYDAALRQLEPQSETTIETILPDGGRRTYQAVRMIAFPRADLMRQFWFPYLVGLIYLFLGAWIYNICHDRPGSRAFAFFCIWTAIALGFLFDLGSTRLATPLWTLAVALIGGSLTSLALRFPKSFPLIERRPRLRYLPYALSLALAIPSLFAIYDLESPWRYINTWRLSYAYAAFGIVFFLLLLLLRTRQRQEPVVRQQARIILAGSLIAFLPIAIWLAAPLIGVFIHWEPAFYLPFLLVFPVSIGVAIQRYRLWDFDLLVNRAIIYGLLTLVLLLAYVFSTVLVQIIFTDYLELTATLRTILLTFIILALFIPAKNRIQDIIDRRFFRHKYDANRILTALSQTLRSQIDLEHLRAELVRVVQEAMKPVFASLCLSGDDLPAQTCAISPSDPLWDHLRQTKEVVHLDELTLETPGLESLRAEGARLLIPLVSQDEIIGILYLGQRQSGQVYTSDDRRLLSILAGQAATALQAAQLVRRQQAEALQRQREEYDMRLAALVQQTQLPRQLPDLPGWRFSSHYHPAQAIGGEFYDFIPLQDGRLAFLIGDVSARGTPSALVMAETRGLLLATARQLEAPEAILAKVNALLQPDVLDKIYVTCFYAVLEPISGRLVYANAGHNPPYRLGSATPVGMAGVEELPGSGFPLGVFPEARYDAYTAHLQAGESLFLYSDGVVEARNAEKQMLSYAGLEELLRNIAATPGELIPRLLSALREFTGEAWEQQDDLTLVCLERLPDRA